MKNNLTQGNIMKTLVWFTVPLILSGLLQQMFNWVDAFVVGNVEGELALCKRQVLFSKKWKLFSGIFWQIKSSTFAYNSPRTIRGAFFN